MLGTESLHTFADLTKLLPRIDGKKLHVSTLHRWCRKGVRGVVLEFRMLGGRMLTSVEAVERFSRTLSEGGAMPRRSAFRGRPRRRTDQERAAAIARAERILEEAGI